MRITVDCSQDLGELRHFWASTGFSPASLLLHVDMRQAMAYVASIPHGGITYVRPHYLLDLVIAERREGQPTYDWSVLDKALDVLVGNGLRPLFELMGNPSELFSDFGTDAQIREWRRLVRELARHCVDRYGAATVRSWYFEAWNEPDAGWWPGTEQAFCNYYDACSEGLRDVDPLIRLGGPGTCRHLSSMLKAFLAHCSSGASYFATDSGVRLDFVSFHEKGAPRCEEDLTPDSLGITRREREIIEYIRENHPTLAAVPVMNNECDPQVGWWDTHTWRARPYYAALACKIINQHLLELVGRPGCRYELLSNDNGFLGAWGQRTLLARFGDIVDGRAQVEHRTRSSDLREDPGRRRFEMVKKPIFNAMVLLSLLGDRRCAIDGVQGSAADIGAIASTRERNQVAVLIYHSRDEIMSSGSETVRLELRGVPFDQGILAHYRIDPEHGDPFAVWERMGAPRIPTADELAQMRRQQELSLLEEPQEVALHGGKLSLEFDLPLHGVSLVLLSADPARAPGQVQNVRVDSYDGLTGQAERLIRWDGLDSRMLRTYEVLYAPSERELPVRVNESDLLCTAFLHVCEPGANGIYRVRAIDFWGRKGPDSHPASGQRRERPTPEARA